MKRILASICAILAGWALQHALRPDAQALEVQASTDWNSGDVQQAEWNARRALFQSPESTRACDVLIEVARHNGRPQLLIAATEARYRAQGRELEGLIAAGDIAISRNLLRLAEQCWEEALRLNTRDARVHQRLTVLAGMRLDFQSMQSRLRSWSEIGTPDPNLTLLYLGLPSIDERDASSAFDLLHTAVEADQLDNQSQLGLARCLFAMSRHAACVAVLSVDSGAAASIKAAAMAIGDRAQEAEHLLQQTTDEQDTANLGPRHFARGLIASANENWTLAEQQFELAVKYQPLSRPFRSRYCETLRRNGSMQRYDEEIARLQHLREIVELAARGTEKADAGIFIRLKELCKAVDAEQAFAILSCYDR